MPITPEFKALVRSSVPGERLFLHIEGEYYFVKGMIELKDGRLLRTTSEGKSVSDDGGITWGDTESLRDDQGQVMEGTLVHLIRLKSGAIGGIRLPPGKQYVPGDPIVKRQYASAVWFCRSEDEGQSWSRPVLMSEPYNNAIVHTTPIVTSSGRIVAAAYNLVGKSYGERGRAMYGDELARVGAHGYELFFTYCWAYYSDDEGITWQTNEGKGVWGAGGELFVTLDYGVGGYHRCNEPAVVEVSEGHLLMLMRAPLGRFYQSWSSDDGTTWSRPEPSHLAVSVTPPVLTRIPGTSDLLVLWNQVSPEEIESGHQRMRLSSAISRDGGATWDHGENVLSMFRDRGDRTYVEPPPIKYYRALELAPRLPQNVLMGTYPFLAFWKDRAIIWFQCARGIDYAIPPEATPEGYMVGEVGGPYTIATIGLPITWFYEDLRKYGRS